MPCVGCNSLPEAVASAVVDRATSKGSIGAGGTPRYAPWAISANASTTSASRKPHVIRNREHPDVVQEAAAPQRLQIVLAEPQPATQAYRVIRHARAMPAAVAIPRFDHGGERHDDGGRRIEIVRIVLDPRERADPGQQFALIDRLGEKVVGSGLETLDALIGRIHPGDDDDGRQPGGDVLPDSPTDLESADLGQIHVEKDHVR